MTFALQLGLIRPVVARAIPKLALPKLPVVRDDLWSTHASYDGALAHAAESPKGFGARNHGGLEVCRLL